ncbi:DNA-directed RNA polymerase sigma-70 factor [Paenibacillus montaniterrae]|uniref:DNA-directed RNA polymerase sigma-70 factor n=1 Tax=Paenibacillus montaniterrae TaxID=429341 RepID=A0A920CV79_9BACL|nr:sigma-70 family RNA polymerase sigma factor [Paenibacillus montaniterrae]GIP14721.1 DNA-directed RNA polymerase sigma-70 factor [Paenibacillus montaniterrae]
MEELDLATELRKRNEKALYQLIDLYGGLIKSIIRKHAQPPDAYDECMDDILLSIWNNIDQFNGEKNSFKNWVAATAKYKAIDYQRKHYRALKRYAFEGSSTLELIETPSGNDQDISYEMEQLLAHLSQNDQQLLVKHYVKECTVHEIAHDMGVKPSRIYNRLSRARRKLRAILNEFKLD